MSKKTGPYIGVIGFMFRDEIIKALSVLPHESRYRLMVGILMGDKTLAGETNKWPGRFPKKEAVREIFVNDPRTFNLVHYSTNCPETLLSQLMEITKLAGPYFDGFQLNMPWPPISHIYDYREANPDKYILLQIGKRAVTIIESMERFTKLVGVYSLIVDGVLIDVSGGRGKPLDVIKVAQYLRAVSNYPKLDFGIAGGLGPKTLDMITHLVEEFPNLSIDAESCLRTPEPEDALCLKSMCAYLEDAFSLTAKR
ncbi:MAG: hypothetical protein CO183_00360 [Candidatus Zambryskibacteria bacterium CG_4_9_14_3_um_filter_42_9]|uniref:Phosphoribosylanthranilate isomerase n=1 Tax=Candidatus Zambryskibacteria bacterium CG22_combo_CG10-13_8_21_14_all_42_17 TaxID=1975118 RepID=A0A2H0BCU0_9BACT|nr:MAG: hypothetical protein COX06_02980 [Candidatus Zambryskibacteria bacterium CG22_combo_CG10-13_8_21_14_all_42_17]PJA37009.1 MAG: hypothetical protein CO183_00360 [Candidatus Zambryskibacteria bacterium CG_4_9_14_3_um_filter_42_9]